MAATETVAHSQSGVWGGIINSDTVIPTSPALFTNAIFFPVFIGRVAHSSAFFAPEWEPTGFCDEPFGNVEP